LAPGAWPFGWMWPTTGMWMWSWLWTGWMCAAWHIDEPQQIGSTVALPTGGATAAEAASQAPHSGYK